MNAGPNPLPLFPLTAHVLPGGKLPLRIFEPRYVRMVRQSFGQPGGFGMCMMNTRDSRALRNMYSIGTWVEVVDFEPLEDGLLGITVEGRGAFRIERVWQEADGLRMAAVQYLEQWPDTPLSEGDALLREQLQRLYQQYDYLARLYPQPLPHSATWLCQRWLELLPVAASDKQYLLEQPDCRAALAFLNRALTGQEERPEPLC